MHMLFATKLLATKLLATSYYILRFLMITVEQLSAVLLKHCLDVISMLFVIMLLLTDRFLKVMLIAQGPTYVS